ncbi:putative phosphoglycerate mutase [Kribbella sp. VKM Ac-2571]|uniref:histidine phosphatase family protein n=1 Tax=Kribbella sp. VKM Ac-2571 TaxID=2512222 RepID=UPI0010614DEB|nr:histidine phosphatase family protein [Kribbella sp. VKM Ac-2571]TDO50430.1 putative phosphoglycerate mutase [Kribbella sp. VKM Ac-2571]
MARNPRHSPGLTYLARHGQTEWNVAGRRQGRLDSPLTPLGLEQAHRNAQLLAGEGIDAIFASPLERARRTASIIASDLGLIVEVVDDLAEIDHGLWSGLESGQIDARWPGQRDAREREKYTYRFPEGESYADAEVRAGRVLEEVGRTGVRRPLLVSHEMIGRMLLRQLGVPDALGTRQPSDVVYRVRADGVLEGLSSSG